MLRIALLRHTKTMSNPASSSTRPHQPPSYIPATPAASTSSAAAADQTTPSQGQSSHRRHRSSISRQQSLRDYYDNDTGSLDGELGIIPSRERRPAETRLERMASGGSTRARSASNAQPRSASRLRTNASHDDSHGARAGIAAAVNEKAPPSSEGTTYHHEATARVGEVDVEKGNLATLPPMASEVAAAAAVEDGTTSSHSPSSAASTNSSSGKDPNLVTWDSPDDPANPRNWPESKRWTVMILVSVFTFMSPLSSSMIAPALPIIAAEFGIDSMVASNITLSIFVLAFAIGPLFMGPISEIFGRRVVIQAANVFFLCWTVGCALAQSQGQLTAFRFLAGLGGAAPLTTGGGTVGDLYIPEERGKGLAVYSLAPLLGPAVGPIVGGAIVEGLNGQWRWIFGVAAIAGGIPFVLGWFLLDETYAPVILARKAKRLRKETGNQALHTIYEKDGVKWPERFRTAFVRPFILLFTQPIVVVLAAYLSAIYGTIYLLLTSINLVFTTVYGENAFIASLNYISLGIGMTIAGQAGGLLVDRIYRRLKAKNGGVGQPEYRLPLLMFSCLFLPTGLIIYGFTVQYKVHWIVPNIGLFFVGLGMMSECRLP